MNEKIEIENSREFDGDIWLNIATAKRGGLIGVGHGYYSSEAIDRAVNHLMEQEKNLHPKSINWENTVEAFLCKN